MILDENVNYIVSGLERSGTSMLMQILHAGEIPVSFDNLRLSDKSNPEGYYELAGGKIINKLIDGTFPFENHKGKFIKITSYGLKFLPRGNYKVIYSERNIDEILYSMEKMTGIEDKNRKETRDSFVKLNRMIKKQITSRDDMDILLVNYNKILSNSGENIKKILEFLGVTENIIDKMIKVVDDKLYRQRINVG